MSPPLHLVVSPQEWCLAPTELISELRVRDGMFPRLYLTADIIMTDTVVIGHNSSHFIRYKASEMRDLRDSPTNWDVTRGLWLVNNDLIWLLIGHWWPQTALSLAGGDMSDVEGWQARLMEMFSSIFMALTKYGDWKIILMSELAVKGHPSLDKNINIIPGELLLLNMYKTG